ncbi:hypothetical protein Bhyg_05911 [Pseudolycoriella hygida]|uniref:Uncharacterized protein n=1 Tax=Pseudolycoriella hygida TaxID=35572 RepID=A0A9Q0S1X7_9DIPT|nr:hypothetical protein Bhyg_05911 [Pseudolycoriella hygida]
MKPRAKLPSAKMLRTSSLDRSYPRADNDVTTPPARKANQWLSLASSENNLSSPNLESSIDTSFTSFQTPMKDERQYDLNVEGNTSNDSVFLTPNMNTDTDVKVEEVWKTPATAAEFMIMQIHAFDKNESLELEETVKADSSYCTKDDVTSDEDRTQDLPSEVSDGDYWDNVVSESMIPNCSPRGLSLFEDFESSRNTSDIEIWKNENPCNNSIPPLETQETIKEQATPDLGVVNFGEQLNNHIAMVTADSKSVDSQQQLSAQKTELKATISKEMSFQNFSGNGIKSQRLNSNENQLAKSENDPKSRMPASPITLINPESKILRDEKPNFVSGLGEYFVHL